MESMDDDEEARCVVLSGSDHYFTSGMDLSVFADMKAKYDAISCPGRQRLMARDCIVQFQETFTAIEKCRIPVIAAVEGGCIGAGVDMLTACDLCYAHEEAVFSVVEVDVGIIADVGTLQRLPSIVGERTARDWALTGRRVGAPEAREAGLVNDCYESSEALMEAAFATAEMIAKKSPLVIAGVKETLLYARDHPVGDSLTHIANLNAGLLFNHDLKEAMRAMQTKESPTFENLPGTHHI